MLRTPCSLVSHITLEEAGAAYTAVRVDFGKSEQRQPEYAEAGTATSD